jgi:hypothetical protein
MKNLTPDPVVPIHFRECLQHAKHLYPSGSVQFPRGPVDVTRRSVLWQPFININLLLARFVLNCNHGHVVEPSRTLLARVGKTNSSQELAA